MFCAVIIDFNLASKYDRICLSYQVSEVFPHYPWLHLNQRKSKFIRNLEKKSHKTLCTGKTTRWIFSVYDVNYSTTFLRYSCFTVFFGYLLHFSQAPIQIKEFGAITNIDFSPVAPHNFAVTAFTRVCWFLFLHNFFVLNSFYSHVLYRLLFSFRFTYMGHSPRSLSRHLHDLRTRRTVAGSGQMDSCL